MRWLLIIKKETGLDPFVAWVDAKTAREAAEQYMDGSIQEGDSVMVARFECVSHFHREDEPTLVEFREADGGS